MAGSTAVLGLPFPVSSDPFSDGAGVIAALAAKLESNEIIPTDSIASGGASSLWPVGISLMTLTAANAATLGYPNGDPGAIVTIKRSAADLTYQLYFSGLTSGNGCKIMSRVISPNGQSPWRTIAGPSLPIAVATGQVTGTPPAGGVLALNVSFPAGRFGTGPRVVCSINNTSTPQAASASAASVTATGMTVNLYRTTATGTSVAWIATEGME